MIADGQETPVCHGKKMEILNPLKTCIGKAIGLCSINRHKETTHKWRKISGTISHINVLKFLQLRTQMTPKHLKIIRQ